MEFYRASNAKKIEKDGNGIGLAIVRKIIHRHKGTIEVKSQLNKGSVFKITLPYRYK